MRCIDCYYARKHGNEDYVGCVYFQEKLRDSGLSEEGFVRLLIENEKESEEMPKEFGLGWVSPYKFPDDQSINWVTSGTVTEGVMQNNWISVKKEDNCCNYVERGME